MKTIKIVVAILAIVVIIGSIIYMAGASNQDPPKPQLPVNQFTEKISSQIKAIMDRSDNAFCKDSYDEVKYLIDDYSNAQRLGENAADSTGNVQNRSYFFKQLYSVYVEKFIAQAFHVFKGTTWAESKISFINNECKALKAEGKTNSYLEPNGEADKKLNEIMHIIIKYNEIMAFLNKCQGFHYHNTELSARFPVNTAQDLISQSKTYLNGNGYVKNCTHLTSALKNVPQTVYKAHINYLSRKIDHWSGMYEYYNTQIDYRNNLYDPLKTEVIAVRSAHYDVSVDSDIDRLINKLNSDAARAYTYFSNKSNN